MKFVAEDGKMFETAEECLAYEESISPVLAFDRYGNRVENLASACYIYASKANMAAARKELGTVAKEEGWYIYNTVDETWQTPPVYNSCVRRYAEAVEELARNFDQLVEIDRAMRV